jgi:hypothetical protein
MKKLAYWRHHWCWQQEHVSIKTNKEKAPPPQRIAEPGPALAVQLKELKKHVSLRNCGVASVTSCCRYFTKKLQLYTDIMP